jgi:DNA-binding MarR family transcriptional regulator
MVKKEKVIVLEDMALQFNVRPQDVVDKLSELEKEERITGIIDERGKFIYITPQEMLNIAKFINNRGRISISEIAHESNKLVHLSS